MYKFLKFIFLCFAFLFLSWVTIWGWYYYKKYWNYMTSFEGTINDVQMFVLIFGAVCYFVANRYQNVKDKSVKDNIISSCYFFLYITGVLFFIVPLFYYIHRILLSVFMDKTVFFWSVYIVICFVVLTLVNIGCSKRRMKME